MDKIVGQSRRYLISEITKYSVSALILAAAVGFTIYMALNREKPASKTSDILVPTVETIGAEPYTGSLDLLVSGTVVPFKEVKLAAEVAGRIAKKYPLCEPGEFVKKGTPLLEIDRESYELEVKTLEAEVAQSDKMIVETRKDIEGLLRQIEIATQETNLLKNELERNTKLRGVVSPSELEQAQRTLLSSQGQLMSLENSHQTALARMDRMNSALELSKRKYERAVLNLSKTLVTAPEDGVIVKKNVEEGDFVAAGTNLLIFEDTRQVEVICNLSSSDLSWIRQNAPAEPGATSQENEARVAYSLPKLPVTVFDSRNSNLTWSGRLDRYDGIGLDVATKTIPVRVLVEQPVVQVEGDRRALVRGMFVKCLVQIAPERQTEQLLSLPAKAIRPGNFVWTVVDGKMRRHSVVVVDQIQSPQVSERNAVLMAVIKASSDGVKAGDQVIVSPLSQPTDGAQVLLVNKPKSSDSIEEPAKSGTNSGSQTAPTPAAG